MATRTRRPRHMSFDQVKRRIERDERQYERRTSGRWNYLNTDSAVTISNTIRGGQIVTLGQAPGTPAAKRTYYGFDGFISLTADGSTAVERAGALVSLHNRVGQATSDYFMTNPFELPNGDSEGNTIARYHKFMPFVILGNESSTRGSTVIPWRALLPKEVTVLAGETYVIAFGIASGNGQIHVRAFGRMRYIDAPA